MDRRGFLGSILALGMAPAIVRASSLMKVSGIVVATDEELLQYGGLLTPAIITRTALLPPIEIDTGGSLIFEKNPKNDKFLRIRS